MKELKIGKIILNVGIVLYIIENIYFGWNLKAESNLEASLDYYIGLVFTLGLFFYLGPLFTLYEKSVNELDFKNNKNTDK